MSNLPKIQVLELTSKESADTVIKEAKQIHTAGDADVTNPPVTDAALATQIITLQSRVTGSKATPPTFTATQVTTTKTL